MRRHVIIFGARLDLALGLLFILASATLSTRTAPPPVTAQLPIPPPAGREERLLVGTLWAVDLKVRTIEVITGVGHAFRLERLEVTPDAEISDQGVPCGLADIQRGRIVRVQSVTVAPLRTHQLATSVEALAKEETGGVR
jgi:hypothetical protein